ncbi:unnamed protein product [Clonostachys rhizophaga]|uniref:Cytochrome P450 n=1 Tax=Clonostachys rhizophaga TaxID=160324 RepID=A0A9N9VJU8_9HYPO|nr:unnamed protein product [Clonostachys rhizophaga]
MSPLSELLHNLPPQYVGYVYTILLLLIFWVSWRLWRFTISPILHPELPKELPYWIPFLGHGPAFFKSSEALVARASNYCGRQEPFAITLFGSTLYIVANPQHTVEVYKSNHSLSFDEFAEELVRTNGYSKWAAKTSYTDLPKDKAGFPNPKGTSFGGLIRQMHIHQLYPGDRLRVIEDQFLDWYDRNLQLKSIQTGSMVHSSNGNDTTVPLMAWVSDYVTRAGEAAYFGDSLGSIDPDLARAFLEFDDLSWQVLYRYPAFLSGEMRSARRRMMQAFSKYLAIPQEERTNSVWLLKAMEDEARGIGIHDQDIAVLYFNIYWLINTNTRKIAFWMLSFLLHCDASLIDPIHAEIGGAFQGNTLTNLTYICQSCPTLDRVWHESLRLCSNAASVRLIRSDTTIGGKRMLTGNRIMIPYRQLHFDGRVYGADPDNFHPERFDKAKGGGDPTKGHSWRPFGGGNTLCTGRYIARRSTLIFVALILRRFDLELVGPTGPPEPDIGRPVLGISGIKDTEDFMVKLRPR